MRQENAFKSKKKLTKILEAAKKGGVTKNKAATNKKGLPSTIAPSLINKKKKKEGNELTVEPNEIMLNNNYSSPPYPIPLWDDATAEGSSSTSSSSAADRSPTLTLSDDEYTMSEHLLSLESYLTPEPEDDIEAALSTATDEINDSIINTNPFNNDPLSFLSNAINI